MPYLTKQNLALREVNEDRVKIYEQLEESIAELEATNKKIIEDIETQDSDYILQANLYVKKAKAKWRVECTVSGQATGGSPPPPPPPPPPPSTINLAK